MEFSVRNLSHLYSTLSHDDKPLLLPKSNTKQILDSLRILASRVKKRQHYRAAPRNRETTQAFRKKTNEVSPEIKKKADLIHEATLRKELIKFRSEVEFRFKNSATNRIYRFPREANDISPRSPKAGESGKLNLNVCLCHTSGKIEAFPEAALDAVSTKLTLENMLETARSLEPKRDLIIDTKCGTATGSLLTKVKELLKQTSSARTRPPPVVLGRKPREQSSGLRRKRETKEAGSDREQTKENAAKISARHKAKQATIAKMTAAGKSFLFFQPDLILSNTRREDTRLKPGSKRIDTKSFVGRTDLSATSRTAASRRNVGEDFATIASTRAGVQKQVRKEGPPHSATHARIRRFNFAGMAQRKEVGGWNKTQDASFLKKMLMVHASQDGKKGGESRRARSKKK